MGPKVRSLSQIILRRYWVQVLTLIVGGPFVVFTSCRERIRFSLLWLLGRCTIEYYSSLVHAQNGIPKLSYSRRCTYMQWVRSLPSYFICLHRFSTLFYPSRTLLERSYIWIYQSPVSHTSWSSEGFPTPLVLGQEEGSISRVKSSRTTISAITKPILPWC